jgi:hypothetical protein
MLPMDPLFSAVLKMDPLGVLFAFGLAMIVRGFVYRTPIPVQPMKVAGAIATTQAVSHPPWSTVQASQRDLCGF